ncbi:MAG TPA: hypothetical protein EYP04_05130 [Anaerolineae bacterium]|nr:hypothetical protein [Anaerolineae bacterium]HIQ05685.1 hypothetical protein [Anaerolineae bacterium]
MTNERCPLSRRELEILETVAQGLTNQEIALQLKISPNTVKVHLRNIFEKLGVASRTEAVMVAIQHGWVTMPGVERLPPEEEKPLILPRAPLGLWQRIYLIASMVAVVAALVVPQLVRTRAASISGLREPMLFSDQSAPLVGAVVHSDTPRWEIKALLPRARSRLAVVAVDGLLYAIAGESRSGITGAVDIYNPSTDTWRPGTQKPLAVSNVQAAVLHGRIYVPGGTTANGMVTDVVEVYDPAGAEWSQSAPLPAPRAAYALTADGRRLYLFGGWDGARFVDTTWIYDPETEQWQAGPQLTGPRGFAAAVLLDGLIYLIGGYDGREELNLVEVYDPTAISSTISWLRVASMSAPRAGLGVAVQGAALYAIGGGLTSQIPFHERYDPLTNTWSSLDSPVEDVWRNLGVVTLGPKVYAVGGWSGDYLSVNAAYQASVRVFLPLSSRSEQEP